jgi:hypothetical protein
MRRWRPLVLRHAGERTGSRCQCGV